MSNPLNKEPSEGTKELPSTQGTFAKCIINIDEAYAREKWKISWNYIFTPWQKYNGVTFGFIYLFLGIFFLAFLDIFFVPIIGIGFGVYSIYYFLEAEARYLKRIKPTLGKKTYIDFRNASVRIYEDGESARSTCPYSCFNEVLSVENGIVMIFVSDTNMDFNNYLYIPDNALKPIEAKQEIINRINAAKKTPQIEPEVKGVKEGESPAKQKDATDKSTEQPKEDFTSNKEIDDVERQLARYSKMLKEGLISQEDYDNLKSKLLNL
tara:strand:+ start:160 stop:957 length:798 start_codon:yes stop_codon:yes gene_type:complete